MTQDHVEYVTAVIGRLAFILGGAVDIIYRSLRDSGLIDNYLVKNFDVLHTLSLDYVAEDIIDYYKRKGLSIC